MSNISDVVYELRPALYVISGFIAGHTVEHDLAISSGALLAAVGVYVYHLRLIFRSNN